MSEIDTEVAATAPIERTALVVGGVYGSPTEVARDLRAVAMEAAGTWSRAMASSHSDPNEFGRKVALAYLAALRELNAGFVPGTPDSEGHV